VINVFLTFEPLDEITRFGTFIHPVVLFIMLSLWTKPENVIVQLCIMLCKVVLAYQSDKILKCDHSNESYWAVLICGAVYYAVQGDSNF